MPEKTADWTKADYLRARKTGDWRLTEAVKDLAERTGDKQAAAQLLAVLLKAEPEPEKRTGPAGQPSRMAPHDEMGGPGGRIARLDPQMIESIVTALADNGTELARNTLAQVVDGTLKTDDDRVATVAALRALADQPSPQTDAVLFAALTTPEKLRPASSQVRSGPRGRGLSAEDLAREARQLLEPTASEAFRTKLAQFLLTPTTTREQIARLRTIVEKELPQNVGAQILLYLSPEPDQQTKETLQEYLTGYASQVMGVLLGLTEKPLEKAEVEKKESTSRWGPEPEREGLGRLEEFDRRERERMGGPVRMPARPRGPQGDKLTAEEMAQVARQLCDPKFMKALQERLGQAPSLAEGVGTVMLAATIPQDGLRASLHTLLQKHWQEGPAELEAAGLSEQLIWDPAMFVLVKLVPRTDTEGRREVGPVPGRAPKRTPYPRTPHGGPRDLPPGGAPFVDKKSVQQDWMKTSEALLRLLCERFQSAASRAQEQDSAAPAKGLPFTLHEGAKVVANYDLVWPAGAPKEFSSITFDPLAIHYVRIEETTRYPKTRGYYRRQVKGHREHEIDGGTWLDACRNGSEPGTKQSIDVLITRVEDNPDRPANEDEPLVIEILTIDIRTPEPEKDKK